MADTHEDFYRRIRTQVRDWVASKAGSGNRWFAYVLAAPDLFYLLWKLSFDSRVPLEHKAKLAAALAYFISPIDLIPEAILGPLGYIDDVALAAYVLNGILCDIDPGIVRGHWAGEDDVLDVVKKILAASDRMIGKRLWVRLRRMVSR